MFKYFTKHIDFFKERKKRTTRNVTVGKKVVTMRRAKRKPEKKVFPFKGTLESLPKTLFSRAIHRLVTGCIMSEFSFKLLGDAGTIRFQERHDSISALSNRKEIDAIKARFKYYDLVMTLNANSKCEHVLRGFISFSAELKELYKQQIEAGSAFQSKNVINLFDLAKIVQKEEYPDLDLGLITKIIQHGLKILTASLSRGVDACFFEPSKNKSKRVMEFVYFCNYAKRTKITKKMRYVEKVRFLYEVLETKYSGYYYAALTHEQCNTFNKKPIEVTLYRVMEEAMLIPEICPHIIAYKIYKPFFNKYEIKTTTIKYEKGNTKYIWRWDDKRFESVDNTEFLFNRRFKWDSDNV